MVASASYPQPALRERIPTLDGLRGIAILLVLGFHTTLVQPGGPLESLLFYTLRSWGWSGVDLFFVLSGFLITGVLQDSLERRGPGDRRGYLRDFWARRTLRIFPVYYAYLLLLWALAPAPVWQRVGDDFVFFWLYLQNFAVASAGDFVHTHFLDHFWSLAIEEQFYLVWPFVVWVCGRRRLMALCAGLVAASLALRLGLMALGTAPAAVHVLTPARLDGLAVGAFLACAAREPGGLARWVPAARVTAGLAGLVLLGIALLQDGLFLYVLPGTQGPGLCLLAVFFGALLVLAVTAREQGRWARWLGGGPLVRIGRYSYALYVIHEAVRVLWVLALQRWGIRPYDPQAGLFEQGLVYAGVLGFSLAAAAASWHLFEAPILRLKRFFPR